MCSVSGQSFRLRRLRTMRQTVGSSMFSQVCLACEQALPLGYSREFTWQPHAKDDASTRGGKRSPFPHPSWLRRSLARSLAPCTTIGEQWKYFTDQQSQGPYNTLRSLLLFLFHHTNRAREENGHACAFRVSCLAPFSFAARVLRVAFLWRGVVGFVSLL